MSVSAERGYLRETGNLVFHTALVGMLVTVGIGGGFGYTGQRVVVEGQTFVNMLVDYDSFNPGRFFDRDALAPYRWRSTSSTSIYEQREPRRLRAADRLHGQRTRRRRAGRRRRGPTIKVNEPLRIGGTDVYLLGNGYAPTITVRDPDGNVVFTDSVPFLPQDANLTSLGVVKMPDGLAGAARHDRLLLPDRRRARRPARSPRATPTCATRC